MPQFRKKPVVVEARQVPDVLRDQSNDDHLIALAKWCGGLIEGVAIIIPTLEGDVRADTDDWIVKGVKGEFYPVKPDIFAATYEKVSDG